MNKFTLILKSTGEVISTTTCDESQFNYDSNNFDCLVDTEITGDWYEGGVFHNIPPQPSNSHQWIWQTKQWEDPRTLADLKAAQWALIKQARSNAIDAPLVTPYGTFDSNSTGRTSITDAVLLANNLTAMSMPVAIEFTLSDNSSVTLNAEQMVHVGLLLGQKVQMVHPRSQALRAQIDAATTQAEVDVVVW